MAQRTGKKDRVIELDRSCPGFHRRADPSPCTHILLTTHTTRGASRTFLANTPICHITRPKRPELPTSFSKARGDVSFTSFGLRRSKSKSVATSVTHQHETQGRLPPRWIHAHEMAPRKLYFPAGAPANPHHRPGDAGMRRHRARVCSLNSLRTSLRPCRSERRRAPAHDPHIATKDDPPCPRRPSR